MALSLSILGNPSNQQGGPGSCRAKFAAKDDGGAPGGGVVTITSAQLLAAFPQALVPAELFAILNTPYATDDDAREALTGLMHMSIEAVKQEGVKDYIVNVTRDGVTFKPQILVTIAAGATSERILVEVRFNHSETR